MNRRHVILVGLPGAGKTTVGRLTADLLGAPFTDLDDLITQRAGKSVARIFAEDGESGFRRLEGELGREAFDSSLRVIAVGGGFLEAPERLRDAVAAGLVIYLRTSPETAAGRLAGLNDRPLLAVSDRLARLRQLLVLREESYLVSGLEVTTDSCTAEDIARSVAKLAREQGGW